MIRTLFSPSKIDAIAVSGGLDSMACLNFLLNGKHKPDILYFNHGTKHGIEALQFLFQFVKKNDLSLYVGNISGSKPSDQSWEEWWRQERYRFLESYHGTVATCHHLNDVAENWVMGSIHGRPKLIPFRRNNIIRPFLLTSREKLEHWVSKKKVEYIDDPSNDDLKYDRNKVRHNIIPHILEINPGFLKVISKKVKNEYERSHITKIVPK